MKYRKTKPIGFLVFDGVQPLDLFGPLDAFQEANDVAAKPTKPYSTTIVSKDGLPVVTSSGVTIQAHESIQTCPPLHTLIIPGGSGARNKGFPKDVLEWIALKAPGMRRYGSICTGLFILARTGLLDGQKVTTHWQFINDAQNEFKSLQVVPDQLFVRSGKQFTAAGVTAGIDLALALIDEDLGPSIASDVARQLVVFLKRPGDQRQFSTLLQHQFSTENEFSNLIAWIADNLNGDLSSQNLAERVGLSERQFRRRFAQVFGETPTRRIERLRIEAARNWLSDDGAKIEDIAHELGFATADTFRRSFERLLGIAPSVYRQRFNRVSS